MNSENKEIVSGGNWTSHRQRGIYFGCLISLPKTGNKLFRLVCDCFFQENKVTWQSQVSIGDWGTLLTGGSYYTEYSRRTETFERRHTLNIIKKEILVKPKLILPQQLIVMVFVGNPYRDKNENGEFRKIEISIFKSIINLNNHPFELDSFDTMVFSEQGEMDKTNIYRGINIAQYRDEIMSKSLIGKIFFITSNYSEQFINGLSLQNALQTALS